jgi:excisionase family DNA binding protein
LNTANDETNEDAMAVKTKRTAKSDEPEQVHATPADAAKFFNVSKVTIYRAIAAGKLKAVDVFGQKRIPWKVLREMSPNAL